jgi:hemoglobin-like flavoprotein
MSIWCAECEQFKGGGVPGDHTVIGDFAVSIGLVDDAGRPTAVGRALTLEFYGRLLGAAPYLAEKFPADILEATEELDSEGLRQRDRLLKAILAVCTLWDPGNDERMPRLDEALDSMGRAHVAHGATFEEYAAVLRIFLAVCSDYARTANVAEVVWTQAYGPALRRALGYASGRMVCAEALAGARQSAAV